MSKYAATVAASRAPLAVRNIPPTVWAQTWTDRPTEVVKLGLRTLSEEDLSAIASLATSRASRYYPGLTDADDAWVEEYNRAVRWGMAGRALCSPESTDVPFWDYPDQVAPMALEPHGAAWLCAELEVETVRRSPLPVGDDEAQGTITKIIESLGTLQAMSPAGRHLVVRHLRAALAAMT